PAADGGGPGRRGRRRAARPRAAPARRRALGRVAGAAGRGRRVSAASSGPRTTDEGGPRLSLVIPMLNESANVPTLFARLFPALDGLRESLGVTSEVVVVDDGSTDGTLAVLREQQHAHPTLRIVCFARNFGQHAAVMAGFEAARGDWIITLDADLQNPPEEIPKLVEAFRTGHDLVNTWREQRDDSWFRLTASRLANPIIPPSSAIPLPDFPSTLPPSH